MDLIPIRLSGCRSTFQSCHGLKSVGFPAQGGRKYHLASMRITIDHVFKVIPIDLTTQLHKSIHKA